MERSEFYNLIAGLFRYFRFKDSPPAAVIDDWHTNLKFINSDAVGYIKDRFHENDSLPRNIPKQIKSFYAQYNRENPNRNHIKYDLEEDLRFPIDKLYKAQEVYIKSGRNAFMEYCGANKMPRTDRERVENKVKHIIEVEKVESFVDGVGEDIKDLVKPPSQVDKLKESERQKGAIQNDIPF